ncbi:MAG: DUF4153 domain-containing protein [Flavobacterium sp.]|nr:MAG: DUF4153 domain-containing protein [Flavobacterium sp.]
MKLPSVQTLWKGFIQVAFRFPIQLIIAVISTAVWWYIIGRNSINDDDWNKLLVVFNLALTLLLASDLYCEAHQKSSTTKNLLRIIGLVLCAGLYLVLSPWEYLSDVFRVCLLAFAFHLLVAFAPFIGRKNLNGFWQYNKTLFIRFLTSAFYAAVLYAGLAIALFAIDGLFSVKIDYKIYLKLFALVSAGFTTVFFLAGVPNSFSALDEDQSYPKGLKIFTQYVLIPLMTIYLAILLVYEIKIIIEWTLPKGLVSTLILGYAVFGILSLLLIYPIKDKDGNGWIRIFSKFFYLMMIPLVVLLILAIGKRVSNYGITESRYILLVLALWLAVVTAYFLISKKQNIKMIPISLCIISILATYGPQSASYISKYSQISRLEKLMQSTKKDDIAERPSVVRYLVERHGLLAIQGFTKVDVNAIDVKMNNLAVKNKYYSYRIKSDRVDTAFALLKIKSEYSYDYNSVIFLNENRGLVLLNGYEAIFSFNSYNTDSAKLFDQTKFSLKQSLYNSKEKNKIFVDIGMSEVLVFDLTQTVANNYANYKAGKLTKDNHDGYVCPSEIMQLTRNSKHYTLKLVISKMNGGFDNSEQSFDNFDFEGYLLIKKK